MSNATLAYSQKVFQADKFLAQSEDAEKSFKKWLRIEEHAREPLSRQTAEQKFYSLAERWRSETRYVSSINQICMHPAYQEIIGMGKEALPFLIRELRSDPYYWFWALKAIAAADPVKPEDRGQIKKMSEAWLKWAEEEGYGSRF